MHGLASSLQLLVKSRISIPVGLRHTPGAADECTSRQDLASAGLVKAKAVKDVMLTDREFCTNLCLQIKKSGENSNKLVKIFRR